MDQETASQLSEMNIEVVIPAKAGIQGKCMLEMDPGSEPGMTEFSNWRNSNPMFPSTVASKSHVNQLFEIIK